jgi:hypothetical protein
MWLQKMSADKAAAHFLATLVQAMMHEPDRIRRNNTNENAIPSCALIDDVYFLLFHFSAIQLLKDEIYI